ncbi:nucleotidyltransferase family protein [Phosphitispora fastidiosa]|uniref:nucleotidyltransferase family protein n=1 Tax=Phosphitispora fastidiosa TaxID=2837202 RepID=UPI001E4F89BB|nr:nucleotidyltransferase domain-containing protein [Phosphitispora fastidiosa]MBU7008238.1 putative nucleotidyltransferase [Phosphitispora fastidiosa]
MLNLNQIKTAITEVAGSYPVKTVSLFGSYAEDTATENSDIDILVEFLTPSISLFTLLELKFAIEEKLGKDVDVIHAPLDENALINPTKVVRIYEQ